MKGYVVHCMRKPRDQYDDPINAEYSGVVHGDPIDATMECQEAQQTGLFWRAWIETVEAVKIDKED